MAINDPVYNLAKKFRERSEALSLKGKKRDDAALEYFVGAAVIAYEIEGPESKTGERLSRIASYLISVRGYMAVMEIMREIEVKETV